MLKRELKGADVPHQAGRKMALSLPRRWIGDLIHAARQVPSIPVQRTIDVGRVRAARDRLADRPGWCPIFIKAFALVARRIPELRRAYIRYPVPHLYEHPTSVAMIAIERDFAGEPAVFFGRVRAPELESLAYLHERLQRFKEEPIERINLFRRAILVARFPRPVRRFLWWFGMNFSGQKRAGRLGTFGVSVYSGLGAESLHPLSPLTCALNYGVIDPAGHVAVRIVYDHRVLDGATIARALAELQHVLDHDIAGELEHIAGRAAA